MEKPKIIINEKEIDMQEITLGLWLEMARIYDEIQNCQYVDTKYIELQAKMIALAFDLPKEEVLQMPIEDVLPTYTQIAQYLKEVLMAKTQEKKADISTEK